MQSVLEGEDLGWGTVDVTIIWNVVGLDVLQSHVVTVGWDDWDDHGLGEDGETGSLVGVDVGSVVTKNGVWWLVEVGSQGDLVGEGTGDTEETGLLAGELGDGLLESGSVDILTVDGVTDGGAEGGLDHGLGGSGEGVGTQIVRRGDVLAWQFHFDRHVGEGCGLWVMMSRWSEFTDKSARRSINSTPMHPTQPGLRNAMQWQKEKHSTAQHRTARHSSDEEGERTRPSPREKSAMSSDARRKSRAGDTRLENFSARRAVRCAGGPWGAPWEVIIVTDTAAIVSQL